MFHAKNNYGMNPRVIGGLMEDFFNNGWGRVVSDERLDVHSVPVNVNESDKEYGLQVVAPGLKKEDFKIAIDKNILTISFEQKKEETSTETKTEMVKTIRSEYKFHSFKRSFTLNDKIDTSGISAKYTDGILNISLPKKEVAEPTKQEIAVL
jgi:HSP20 family protein